MRRSDLPDRVIAYLRKSLPDAVEMTELKRRFGTDVRGAIDTLLREKSIENPHKGWYRHPQARKETAA